MKTAESLDFQGFTAQPLENQGVVVWSKRRESNPPSKLGKLVYYRCTTPARLAAAMAAGKYILL